MTIKDIMDNIEVQGTVIVKHWDEEKEDYDITQEFCGDTDLASRPIKYLYAVDGALVIEVGEKEE